MFGVAKKSANDNEPPQPGPFGRFYLQELINSGGMAELWLATDSKGKSYALRRLHERLRFDFTARKRFFADARFWKRFRITTASSVTSSMAKWTGVFIC